MHTNDFGSSPVNFIFSAMPVFIGIFFIVFFGIIIVSVVKGITQWNRNNNSPLATAEVN